MPTKDLCACKDHKNKVQRLDGFGSTFHKCKFGFFDERNSNMHKHICKFFPSIVSNARGRCVDCNARTSNEIMAEDSDEYIYVCENCAE